MTKTEKLTQLLIEHCIGKNVWLVDGEIEDPLPASIEYQPNKGWFLVFNEARWYYDQGEFLGKTYEQAVKGLKFLF